VLWHHVALYWSTFCAMAPRSAVPYLSADVLEQYATAILKTEVELQVGCRAHPDIFAVLVLQNCTVITD
jgi:hypothetical protein